MAYDVQTAQAVVDYFARLAADGTVSADALAALIAQYTDELASDADHFFGRAPLAHEALQFRYDTVVWDGAVLQQFDMIVDMSRAGYGVIVVVYAEHSVPPAPEDDRG